MKCSECFYFDLNTLTCRKYTPKPSLHLNEQDKNQYDVWAVVSKDDWCGEFKDNSFRDYGSTKEIAEIAMNALIQLQDKMLFHKNYGRISYTKTLKILEKLSQ
jgi:hypothetical protein